MTTSTKFELSKDAAVRRYVAFGEGPGRRPQFPQQAAEVGSLFGKAPAAALGLEIMLVPEAALLLGIGRFSCLREVLNLIAGACHEPRNALRPKRRDDAGCPRAPIETRQDSLPDFERIEQFEEVLTYRRLFAGPHDVRRDEARGAVAAQIRHDRAKARFVDERYEVVECPRIVGIAVQEHDRQSIGRAALLVSHIEDAGSDEADPGQELFSNSQEA